MNKLKLDLDTLVIETFNAGPLARATVRAHQSNTSPYNSCFTCVTCVGITCP